jgi:hypothetical protein
MPEELTNSPEASACRLERMLRDHRLVANRGRTMQITRNNPDTSPGPGDWFSGSVFVDTVAAPSDGSQVAAASVHFTPGARVEWGRHVSDDEYAQAPSLEDGDR